MADAPPPGVDRAAAVVEVENWLTSVAGAVALGGDCLARYNGAPTHGWRLVFMAEGQPITIDLVIGIGFPFTKPAIHWVDAPPFPSIPHADKDGTICVLPSAASIDPLEPLKVVMTILAGVEQVFGKGLGGENTDDFRAEFRSYWNEVATGWEIISVVDPCEPSRSVVGWTQGKTIVVAETTQSLRNWVGNAFGKRSIANTSLVRVPLIWLDQLPIPSEYPATEADVARLVATAGPDAERHYARAISDEAETTIVLFGATSPGGGASFGGVTLSRRRRGFDRSARRVRGFRREAPEPLVRKGRNLDSVRLSQVSRADPWWIHGRDTQEDLETLLGSSVAIIGCGSLGSPLARLLAQAGVGHLSLIDPDVMMFANAGRHALGVNALGKNKAVALRDRLLREFPHMRVDAWPERWQTVANNDSSVAALLGNDLLVSTVGEWGAECALNAVLLDASFAPPIIYSWAEPHAAGGHAVLVAKGGGCLACGLTRFGGSTLSVAAFDQPTLKREPACGAFFQPYGAGDINVISALASSLALDALFERTVGGDHRIVSTPAANIEGNGGRLTREWIDLSAGSELGGNQVARRWERRADCQYCGGKGV